MNRAPAIYLDYNATAPMKPEVRDLCAQLMDQPFNASSVHSYGRQAHKIIEDARARVAALVGASPTEVIFNSGATEGNNTVLQAFAGRRVLVSAIEHPCVLNVLPEAEQIPVSPDGVVDLRALEGLLKEAPTVLVCVMAVNNETGVIQPMAKIAGLTKKYGARLHCDAVQAVGRIKLNMLELGADFLTLSAHKIGGPQGVGALILGACRDNVPTLLHGGGQEKKARPGTENVVGIAGFGLAAELAAPLNTNNFQTYLEKQLQHISPDIIIHGVNAPRVENTTLFSLPGVKAETLLMSFDLEGVALSNGSACSSGKVDASHVLRAMGVEEHVATGTLRVSTGPATTQEEIDEFLNIWKRIYMRLR